MISQTFSACPHCGEIAEIRDRFVLSSTDGPVEHVQTLCVRRHRFLLPTASLDQASAQIAPAAPAHPGVGQ